MEIVSLNPAFEPVFWELVNQDIPHYYYFAHDWRFHRSESEILLALGKGGRIDGMMLTYKNRIVQLRGTGESVRALLDRLNLEKVELQALERHRQYVLEKYEPAWSNDLMLMILHRGEEKLHLNHTVVTLDLSDARQIAAMMNNSNQELWADVTKEQIIEQMSTMTLAGIKENGELVSIGSMRRTGEVGLIPIVATHTDHRNKGYATSIVSFLVGHILEKMPVAIIYVLGDNAPAIKVYSKVGFKPWRKYFLMKGDRR